MRRPWLGTTKWMRAAPLVAQRTGFGRIVAQRIGFATYSWTHSGKRTGFATHAA